MVLRNNIVLRVINTKTGLHVIWYDIVARKHRQLSLSKAYRQGVYAKNFQR